MLSDTDIRLALENGSIILDPPPQDRDIQPASIDVHLGGHFKRPTRLVGYTLGLREPMPFQDLDVSWIKIPPGGFLLGVLAERLTLGSNLVARVEGKSSVGRHGIGIHVTAGFVDPGWDGNLTLEIFNAGPYTVKLSEGDPIGQLAFDYMSSEVARPYGHVDLGSHYQGSVKAEGARHG